jgi:hypothetical protein
VTVAVTGEQSNATNHAVEQPVAADDPLRAPAEAEREAAACGTFQIGI